MQLNCFPVLFFIACSMSCACQNPPALQMQKIEKNGMTVKWKFEDEHLIFYLNAPTNGWMAVGINESAGLPGTNLIMATILNGEILISDRYILAPGNHQSVAELGGVSSVSPLSGSEKQLESNLSFKIARGSVDRFHYELWPGKRIYLLMAFSQEDDFMHHSIMRTALEIAL